MTPETSRSGGLAIIIATTVAVAFTATVVNTVYPSQPALPVGPSAQLTAKTALGALLVTFGSLGWLAGTLEIYHNCVGDAE